MYVLNRVSLLHQSIASSTVQEKMERERIILDTNMLSLFLTEICLEKKASTACLICFGMSGLQ